MAPGVERRLAAIMFTDIVGSTALMAESEPAGLRAKQRHRTLVRTQVVRYHGEFIEAPGDETLSIFASALEAVSCALAIQAQAEAEPDLRLHIGVHSGDVLLEGGEVHGDGVNVASRICRLSEGGGLCVSGEVYRSIRNQPGIEATSLGEQNLKNVPEPLAVYAARGEAAPPRAISETGREARGRVDPRRAWSVVALVVVALGIGWWLYRPAIDIAPLTSIAVLPFDDLSPGGDQEYFSHGVHEEIIAQLSKISALSVISRTSVMRFKETDKSLREIGQDLGVGSILEGSVRHSEGRVRITTQLVDAHTDAHLWSETYDRDLAEIFAIQSDVARRVATALQAQLTAEERSRIEASPTESGEAYRLYLLGRHHWWKFTEDGFRRSIEYFEKAIAEDPMFALAHAGLGSVYSELGAGLAWIPPSEAFPRARAALARALELDDSLSDAHAELGIVLAGSDWDWRSAERELKRAIALSPDSTFAIMSDAFLLSLQGRHEEAIAAAERAVELDPTSSSANQSLAWRFWDARQYDQTIKAALTALELDPTHAESYRSVGLAYVQKGMFEEAIDALRKHVIHSARDPRSLAYLGYGYGIAGRKDKAREILTELEEMSARRYVSPALIFQVHLGLGNHDQAFRWLEESVEERTRVALWLKVRVDYDPLRSDPRYTKLLMKVGLAG